MISNLKGMILFKKILLFIEKKSDLFNILLIVFSFFYVFVIAKITLDKNVLSLHFFYSFNETMLSRGLFTFTFIIIIWSFQIKNGIRNKTGQTKNLISNLNFKIINMSRTEILQKEILEGVKTIESFSETDRLKVHKIYSDIYKKHRELTREDFETEDGYKFHVSSILTKSNIVNLEFKNLLDKESNVDVAENFFQIKMSLHSMLPKKIIK